MEDILNWNGIKASFKKDKSTFIFSFNNKQKYLPRNDNDSIYCCSTNGPCFGCGKAEIAFFMDLDRGHSYDSEENTFFRDRILTDNKEKWDVKEIEVYKIIYI